MGGGEKEKTDFGWEIRARLLRGNDESTGRVLNVFRLEMLQWYLRYLQLTAFHRARTLLTTKSIIIGASTIVLSTAFDSSILNKRVNKFSSGRVA